MRALAIAGSLRRESYNTQLLRAAEELAPDGLEIDIYNGLAQVPPYDSDEEELGTPPSVADLKRRIAAADVVLVATPEYNSSIPGQLKNALDWVSRPAGQSALNGKPAAAIGASKSMFGGVWAQAELRKVLGAMGGRVIEAELPVPHAHELLEGDRLRLEPEQSERLDGILAELLEAAEVESGLVEPIGELVGL